MQQSLLDMDSNGIFALVVRIAALPASTLQATLLADQQTHFDSFFKSVLYRINFPGIPTVFLNHLTFDVVIPGTS
jgi:hypothetical protein